MESRSLFGDVADRPVHFPRFHGDNELLGALDGRRVVRVYIITKLHEIEGCGGVGEGQWEYRLNFFRAMST